jgi:hypothetical protein
LAIAETTLCSLRSNRKKIPFKEFIEIPTFVFFGKNLTLYWRRNEEKHYEKLVIPVEGLSTGQTGRQTCKG